MVYAPSIQQNGYAELKLGWSHYQILMRIENEDERKYYEIEAIEQQWGIEELKRQYNSSLFERIALSSAQTKVKELSQKGQIIEQPTIGILLCKEKNDSVVQLTLPDKTILQTKLREWTEEFENNETNI